MCKGHWLLENGCVTCVGGVMGTRCVSGIGCMRGIACLRGIVSV